jgi:predicted nucleic acid-binding protein
VNEWLADIVADHEVMISTQVLIELRSVARRKLEPSLNDQQITALIEALAQFSMSADRSQPDPRCPSAGDS